MQWKEGPIEDCRITPLRTFDDARGWLGEFFRNDELPPGLHPVMGYVSATHPGVTRGPHEHEAQTDLFVFTSGHLQLYLWDAREESPTYGHRQRHDVGAAQPTVAIIPPGVVHAYRNVGEADALIVNCPNRLYAGPSRAEPVDEIRHEDRPDTPFVID